MSDETSALAKPEEMRISRREAMLRVGALLGGAAFVGGDRLLAAIETASAPAGVPIGTFSLADIALLDEIAETILPETKTPGAKAAQTGAFMALMVTDCYWPDEQKIFRAGMGAIDAAAHKAHGVSFLQATPAQRLAVLEVLDHEQKRVMDARDAAERRAKGLASQPADATAPTAATNPPPQDPHAPQTAVAVHAGDDEPKLPAHYFRMMKELALLGYFTSEIGCTVAWRYVDTPGRYDPCLPYEPGERAWAAHA
jgi:hypothetical protein